MEKYKFSGTGLSNKEKRWAKSRFQTYQNTYHISSYNDLYLLEELVIREAWLERYKKKIEQLNKPKKETTSDERKAQNKFKHGDVVIPADIRKAVDGLFKEAMDLRDKLGMLVSEKDQDVYEYHRMLVKKFGIYKEENIPEFSTPCPFCKKTIVLNVRTEFLECREHNWQKGKYLFNHYAWKLYKKGTLTKLELAKILKGEQCEDTDYINWLEKYAPKLIQL